MRQRGAFAIEPALEARQHLEDHFMLGDLDIEWATTSSLWRSTTGERQGLVPPTLNSVTSV